MGEDECPICHRVMQLTRHHLIPRSTHEHFRKHPHPTVNDLYVDVYLCRQCHSAVHRFQNEMTLAQEFYSLELLLAAEGIQRWGEYAKRLRVPLRWAQ